MQQHQPPPVPEDSFWVKPKVRQRRAITNIYGLLLGIAMLLSGLLAGIFGTFLFAPALYGWSITETAIARDMGGTATANAAWFATQNSDLLATAGAQALTSDANRLLSQDNDTRATQIVLMMNMTQAYLQNELVLLESTATQSAANVRATRTADAVANSQQMTQIALDYAATQVQLQQNATQVELDFRATQASINQNATAISGNDGASVDDETTITDASDSVAVAQAALPETSPEPTEEPSPTVTATLSPTIRPTQTPTEASTATPKPSLTPSPSPTIRPTRTPVQRATTVQTAESVVAQTVDDSTTGIDINTLRVSAVTDWESDEADDSIRSTIGGAWFLTEETFRGDYVLQTTFLPAFQDSPEYFVLLNIPEEGTGLVLRLQADGLQVRRAGIYQFPVSALTPPVTLETDALLELDENAVDLRLEGQNDLRVAWQRNTLAVLLNDELILQSSVSSNPPDGSVGMLVPTGVHFWAFSVESGAE